MLCMAPCAPGAAPFDKARWTAEQGNFDSDSARSAMVGGIDEAGVRAGATRRYVRMMLGEPDSMGPGADIWYLGRSRSGPSFETLRINYDAHDRVMKTVIRRT
jgi:hypothetical protein